MAASVFAPVASYANFMPCGDLKVAKPAQPAGEFPDDLPRTPPNPAKCKWGVFVDLEDGGRLWRCPAIPDDGEELPEGAPEYAFILDRAGRPQGVFPDTLMAFRLSAFDLFSVDLDGDGERERVLAAWNAQGNGIGINTWTIRIFAHDWSLIGQFDEVLDWSDGNLVSAPRGRRGCDVAITDFVDSKNKQGRDGISFQARFYRLASGKMQPASDRPTLQRRYDKRFERERTAFFRRHEEEVDQGTKGDARTWLSHRSTTRSRPDQKSSR